MLSREVLAVACVWCGVGAAAAAQTVTVDFGTSHHNTLYEDASGQTSGGASSWIFAGLTQQPTLRRGLLAFDVTSIPAGATITSVTLTLHMSRTSAGSEPVSVHRVLSDWGSGASTPPEPGGFGAAAEVGDATWLNTFYQPGGGGQLWSTPGGDFAPDPLATKVVGGVGFYLWSSPALTADVQRWVDQGPASNFGWMLLGNEEVLQSVKRFDSALAADPSVRPRLTVTYSVPGPGAGAVLAAAIVGGPRRRRE
jgi:hypothetical protein